VNQPDRTTYLNQEKLPLPFCPGCGHKTILEHLDRALAALNLDPEEVVIVTDIGCAGLSDRYFHTSALHGLHGRSVTYATGIKMARPDLTVIVLIGDGGFGIGGHHMLNAARRNIGVNVIVFNNLNYGMTGGEHSVTTPPGSRTSTTHYGHIEQPLDICGSVGVNGASFTARTTTFDPNLTDLFAQAIPHPGFSLVDVWELCTAYYAPGNKMSKRALEKTMKELNFSQGILREEQKPEFSQRYRDQVIKPVRGKPSPARNEIQPGYHHNLERTWSILIAGAAGTKIQTAGTLLSLGAIFAGLNATQANDYPVTVKTGHSLAEITLSPEEILTTGQQKPDVMLVLFEEGLAKCYSRIQDLSAKDLLIIPRAFPHLETRAETWRLDFRSLPRWGRRKEYRGLLALGVLLRKRGLYPLDALEDAIRLKPRYAEDNLAALDASQKIALKIS
jgi:pyruvate/2-oxoacid:ferredoxin oxidoreductase beta subunit/Pyruvate/2-oxoacid:ferredoxin oxidoreductase gamma subunit